jgi:RHS repeat-associated protein
LERYAYSAFGVRRIMAADFSPRSTSSYAWDFGFQGQFRDAETGWYNYGYRFYVPLLGRWINRDPIEEEGGANLYIFAGNRPTNITDYLGLKNVTEYASRCSVTFQCSCGNGDPCGGATVEGFGLGISPAEAEAQAVREVVARIDKEYGDGDPCVANEGDCLCPSRPENPYGNQQECRDSGSGFTNNGCHTDVAVPERRIDPPTPPPPNPPGSKLRPPGDYKIF